MIQLKYFYDPVLKCHDNRYTVNYYCSDGKTRVWSGSINGDTYQFVLSTVTSIVNNLNKPKALFGNDGRLMTWVRWKKRIRNQKKYEVV